MKTVRYQYQREKKQNPYIGFTSFQHFRNDELYSDLVVKPENNMTETEKMLAGKLYDPSDEETTQGAHTL